MNSILLFKQNRKKKISRKLKNVDCVFDMIAQKP